MKLCYIDTETTGTHPKYNGLIQISGLIEIDGIVKKEFDFTVRPFPDDQIEQTALDITRRTREEILNFPAPVDVFSKLRNIFNEFIDVNQKNDRYFFVAYNAMFDWNFLRSFFYKNDNEDFSYYFFFPPIDVMYLAAEFLKSKRANMTNFKLETVAQEVGIAVNKDNFHDSLYDIQITRDVYNCLRMDEFRVESEDTSKDNFSESLF